MSDTSFEHLSPEQFRAAGYALIDWLVDYRARVAELPVKSPLAPGDVRAQLPPAAPEQGTDFKAILEDVERIIVPGLMHWQSPNFFGYFPANASPPSILGDLLSSGLGVQGMLWLTSPACTELESHVLDWLVDALGLPQRFKTTTAGGGVIQDSASSATLCALLAARERIADYTVRQQGVPPGLVAYCSEETHSSLDKAVSIAGIGRAQLRKIATDERLAMRVDALAAAIAADRAAGLTPFFVCATIGTTSSLAIDPVREIAALCQAEGLWLHVDGAMAGSATLCPEYRHLNDGMEGVDSYCFNPHKWLLTNFDCDCFFVADREPLIRALTVLPEYLRNDATAGGEAIDYRDWQIPLGRRFRALKLWFVLRSYGLEALRSFIRQHLALAEEFAQWVTEDSRFELVAPRSLNLICFRLKGSDQENQRLLKRLNDSGRLFMSHTVIGGRYALRFCIGQTYTTREHVVEAWRLITAL
ncbi:MAG: aspartate aminotransferase family protein [Gammaproteobacteria bacterium]|nr:aspartate aminotransferase family protein [Gammaproteobacteria bacterium]